MPKRKWDDVTEEVRQLVEMMPDARSRPAGRARWRALWVAHFEGERMPARPVSDVSLMVCFGVDFAIQDGRYADALELTRRFFGHPQAADDSKISLMHHRARIMESLLYLGREAEAIEAGREVLDQPRPHDVRTAGLILWQPLYLWLLEEHEGQPSRELTSFVREALAARNPKLRVTLEPPAAYEDLITAMTLAIGGTPAEREQAREGWTEWVHRRRDA